MITLRCTQRLLKYLGVKPSEEPKPPTAALGDWYANLIPTYAGGLIIFVNECSLLTVSEPRGEPSHLLQEFQMRLGDMLGMIGIPPYFIQHELLHYGEVQIAKTASKSILGSMNDFAWNYQYHIDEDFDKPSFSLSKIAFNLNHMPCKPIGWQYPADAAKQFLFGEGGNS